ncbi:hypothetical protein Val02_65050 [Virgisporangium aliadipatigenens]|uniref:DUF5710 domain-containing protein n=1 Tax=Virgisporangium aliadipatigenens TaxID=741659 RepID=A0A8J3YQ49_9ACTN|nr:DUF5710 domain-containing protein [Virgisporangium aliadipatigenens]GIJ49619.1 hypothetical protein Val02_65050 [Virgisporangium aliadipatigenens]
MVTERIWLDVPFAEKDAAKRAGARWDRDAKRWYAPRAGITALQAWAARADVPDLLPGEDRSLGAGLFVDLVPRSCWFTNVRSCVDQRDWERLRRMITRRAGHRCEICGAAEDPRAKRWLEAHERWTYNDTTRVQRLGRLICLCSRCHGVTHFGLAQVRGRETEAYAHLMAVTGMTRAEAVEHVEVAFEVWFQLSRIRWALDLSILTDAGITVTPPPDAADRDAIATETLSRQSRGRPGP